MSSLRHVVKSRPYRERSQPAARAKLGLLEKHKDYVLRARDFHKKQDTIHRMREKAAAKNPDEFYFGMNRSQMTGGVHKKAKEAGPSGDELKAFRKDDATYVAMKHKMESQAASFAPTTTTFAATAAPPRPLPRLPPRCDLTRPPLRSESGEAPRQSARRVAAAAASKQADRFRRPFRRWWRRRRRHLE